MKLGMTIAGLAEAAGGKLLKGDAPVAISGSNSKIITKEILRAVFAEAGETCASQAVSNNHFGLPISLPELAERHKYAVLELGASPRGDTS